MIKMADGFELVVRTQGTGSSLDVQTYGGVYGSSAEVKRQLATAAYVSADACAERHRQLSEMDRIAEVTGNG